MGICYILYMRDMKANYLIRLDDKGIVMPMGKHTGIEDGIGAGGRVFRLSAWLGVLLALLGACSGGTSPVRHYTDGGKEGVVDGSGAFGRWVRDAHGLAAYRYEMDPLSDERAIWLKGDQPSRLHWHQLGNFRINALASNLGFVQLFYNDTALRWLNYYYPESLALSGGFGIVLEGDQAFTSYYPFRPEGSDLRRVFGAAYYEKELAYDQIRLCEKVFAPAGDRPVLIMRVRIRNESKEYRNLCYLAYFDVAPFDLQPPFLTALLPEEWGMLVSDLNQFRIDQHPERSCLIARSPKQWGPEGGYPDRP